MKKINKILTLIFALSLFFIPSSSFQDPRIIDTAISHKESLNQFRTAEKRNIENIAIFISFDGDATKVPHPIDDEQSIKNAETIFNSDDLFDMVGPNGIVKVPSFKKYYEKQSYGALSISTSFLPKKDGKVVSFQDPNPIGYYLKYSTGNTIGYRDNAELLKRETELVENALAHISSEITNLNFTADDLDTDKNGYIDAITLIVETQKNMPTTISWNDLLWSHMRDNDGIQSSLLGKKVRSYTLLQASDYTEAAGLFSLNRGTYGTLVHEFGHSLGYKDLYRYGSSTSKPVGFYDIMGSSIGSNPQDFLTYFISEYDASTAWHTPIPSIDKTTENITLYKPKFIDKDEKRALKLLIDGTPEQFFVVEYYEKRDTFNTYTADQSGIIIYRVNEDNKYLGSSDDSNDGKYDHIYVFRPGETSLGAGQGNLTQATLNMNRPTFGKDLNLADKTFDGETLFLSNGSNTGIKINVTAETSESITFTVTYPSHDGSGTQSDPYLIGDVDTFVYLMGLNTKNKFYKLTSDLDFKDVKNYPLIDFEGSLDGDGKTLKNISSTDSGIFDNLGNFGAHSTIENLNIENLTAYTKGGNHLGALANYASNVTIKNVHIKNGTVTNEGNSINSIVSTGGFIGSADNTVVIEDSSTKIHVSANQTVGGFLGINMGAKIKDCFAQGSIESKLRKGGFIGLQAITSSPYIAPENAFFDSSEDENLKAVGGYAQNMHDLSILDENSLSKNITAISLGKNLTIKENSHANVPIKTTPNKNVTYDVTIENKDVASYQNKLLLGLKTGTTKVYIDVLVGKGRMRLETNIVVERGDGSLSENEFLVLLGLHKKNDFVVGFNLNTPINDIKDKISNITGTSLKSFTDSTGTELQGGIISTGMVFTVTIDNTDYTYTIVIKGDVNGDGLIYATDYVKIKNYIMNKGTLTGPYAFAADIDGDGKIYATDYVQIKNHIMGKKPIEQK